MTASPAILVAGIGRAERGDDAAGPLVARAIARRAVPGVEVRVCGDDLLALVEAWHGRAAVVLVDAMNAGVPPGTILRFDAIRDPLPPGTVGVSSHAFGLERAIELARVLRQLPGSLVVYGIQGSRFGPGASVSPEVRIAVAEAAARIAEEIEGAAACPTW